MKKISNFSVLMVLLAFFFSACEKQELQPKTITTYPDTLVVNYDFGQPYGFNGCIYPYKVIVLNVNVDGAIAYRWLDNNSPIPQKIFSSPNEYDLEVTFGINDIDTLRFYADECTPRVYVPTSFTPEGNLINDTWYPVWNNIRAMHWEIRTEDGIKIFETDDMQDGEWNGELPNGSQAPPGYYMYYINYSTLTETNIILTGHIELIR